MYFNDVHIAYYVGAIILGLIVGQIVDWANKRLPEYKSVISKDFFTEHKKNFKLNYILMFIMAILYVALIYRFGIQETFIANLDLIKYMFLTPMLLCAFVIDYRLQIIPNRLNLTIFEIGLIIAFLCGISYTTITLDMLLGMLVGVGLFLLITLSSKFISGKYLIGLGDAKLMGALGLYFGMTNIIVISLVAFFLAAIVSIILIILKIKKPEEQISFGPFIVISSIISILVPTDTIILILAKICTLGLYKIK